MMKSSSTSLKPSSAFTLVCISAAFDSISWGLAYPVYYALQAELGMSTVDSGWLTSFLCFVTFLSTPLVGYASDKIGRRVCLQLSALSACVGHLVCYLARTQMTYILGRSLCSPLKCCYAVCQAYCSDLVEYELPNGLPSEKKAARLGYQGRLLSYMSFAWMLGPILGGYIGDSFGNASPWLLAGLGHGLNVLIATSLPTVPIRRHEKASLGRKADEYLPPVSDKEESRMTPRRSSRLKNKNKKANGQDQDEYKPKSDSGGSWTYTVLMIHLKFIFQLGNIMYETMFPTYIKEALFAVAPGMSSSITGYTLGWIGVVNGLASAYLLRPLDGAFGHSYLLLASLALTMATGVCGWSRCEALWTLILWSSLIAMANTIWASLMNEYITRDTSPGNKGSYIVFLQNVDRAARITGSPLAGYVRENMGFPMLGSCAGSLHLYAAGVLCAMEVLCPQTRPKKMKAE